MARRQDIVKDGGIELLVEHYRRGGKDIRRNSVIVFSGITRSEFHELEAHFIGDSPDNHKVIWLMGRECPRIKIIYYD